MSSSRTLRASGNVGVGVGGVDVGHVVGADDRVERVQAFLPSGGYKQVQQLVHLRLLHLVKSRVTVQDRPGNIYEAYLLDLGQYSGERKQRDLTMRGFWKTGSDDESRRRALIDRPSDSDSATWSGAAQTPPASSGQGPI